MKKVDHKFFVFIVDGLCESPKDVSYGNQIRLAKSLYRKNKNIDFWTWFVSQKGVKVKNLLVFSRKEGKNILDSYKRQYNNAEKIKKKKADQKIELESEILDFDEEYKEPKKRKLLDL
jgi:hypothetical protein